MHGIKLKWCLLGGVGYRQGNASLLLYIKSVECASGILSIIELIRTSAEEYKLCNELL